MPRVEKQAPGRIPRSNGEVSILSRARAVDQLPQAPSKILLYGQNRVGKTWLACEAEKPLLLLSLEPSQSGGAETVRKVPGIKMLRLGSKQQCEKEEADFWNTTQVVQIARELQHDRYFK